VQEAGQVLAAQHGLHFACQAQHVLGAPGGQGACVQHQQAFVRMPVFAGQGLLAQPVQQGVAVTGVQDAVQRVAPRGLAHAVRHGQQVQVVVAQQAAQRTFVLHAAAQHGGRVGASVHQVAQQVHRVAAG
jgi:hypothetical protein